MTMKEVALSADVHRLRSRKLRRSGNGNEPKLWSKSDY